MEFLRKCIVEFLVVFSGFFGGGRGFFPRFLGFRGDFTRVFGIGGFRGYFLYFSAVVIRLFGVSGVLGDVFGVLLSFLSVGWGFRWRWAFSRVFFWLFEGTLRILEVFIWIFGLYLEGLGEGEGCLREFQDIYLFFGIF